MTSPISEELTARLSAFATETFGLRFPPDRWSELGCSVAAAALDLGIADLHGWVNRLVNGAAPHDEVMALANHLTVSETYFFRQNDTFETLEKQILPARIAERRQRAARLRIWSAGCATGEEPYSIAILVRKRFPDVRPETVSIFGTDIAAQALAKAERGRYSEWSFRDAPEWLKPEYFHTTSPGRYEICTEIRNMVHFSQLNLAAPFYPAEFGSRADFDIILCRNVLMYFSAEWQDRILRRFTQALAPGGWMLVGPCDVTPDEAVGLRLQSTRPGIFQKMPQAVPDATPRALPAAPPRERARTENERRNAGRAHEGPTHAAPRVKQSTRLSAPPPPVAAPLAVARVHADRGELDAALAACDQALSVNKTDAGTHHLRACVLLELNRVEEAEAGFRRVLFLDPESVMARFALGTLAQRTGRSDEARHQLTQVLAMLASRNRGEHVPEGEGMTVGRLREVVEQSLGNNAASRS